MCCYRDTKNYERFNLVVQSLICLTVFQLKNIQQLLDKHLVANQPLAEDGLQKTTKADDEVPAIVSEQSTLPDATLKSKTASIDNVPGNSTTNLPEDINQWTLNELEKLLILVSKAFLLNFPLYIAYKHGVHSRLDEITAQEAQVCRYN